MGSIYASGGITSINTAKETGTYDLTVLTTSVCMYVCMYVCTRSYRAIQNERLVGFYQGAGKHGHAFPRPGVDVPKMN